MINTYLQHSDIIGEQPSLVDRLQSTQTDFEDMITKAYGELILDIKNMNYDMRKLGIALAIHSGAVTTSDVSAASKLDYINMSRLVVKVTTITTADTYTITLHGCDTSDGTYTDITTINFNDIGTYTTQFFDYYKYYKTKVEATGGSVSIDYTSTLIETVYFYLHLYKTIADIYSTLQRRVDDMWESKAMEYSEKYTSLLSSGLFFVDADDDKVISSTDASRDTRTLRLQL